MKERPILYSGVMVNAILAGTKTMTRRIVKPPPRLGVRGDGLPCYGGGNAPDGIGPVYNVWEPRRGEVIPLAEGCRYRWEQRCPYGVPGDRLWVRETFAPCYFDDGRPAFRADWTDESADLVKPPKWKPAIHMPRSLSRIDLEVTEVRVERLQDITEDDAEAEGVESIKGPAEYHYHGTTGEFVGETYPDESHVRGFEWLWDQINGKRAPWISNPWVWVVSFKRVRP